MADGRACGGGEGCAQCGGGGGGGDGGGREDGAVAVAGTAFVAGGAGSREGGAGSAMENARGQSRCTRCLRN